MSLKTVKNPRQINPLQTMSGQTVEDIIIGFDVPGDVQHVVRFYLESLPNITQLSIPMNQRATFRWVPKPGMEIKVGSEDRLLWELESSKDYFGVDVPIDSENLVLPCVWTKGQDRHNQRFIINQSDYEQTE